MTARGPPSFSLCDYKREKRSPLAHGLIVTQVLALIPETWALDLMAGYFVGALRRIQAEHSETTMVKALSGAENVQVQVRLVDRCEELGPSVETSD